MPHSTFSVRQKLLLMAVLAQAGTIAVGVSAGSGLERIIAADERVRAIERTQIAFMHADMLHDTLRGDAFRVETASSELRQDVAVLRADLERTTLASLSDPELARIVADARGRLETYAQAAESLAATGGHDPAALAAFELAFREAQVHNDRAVAALTGLADARVGEATAAQRTTWTQLVLGQIATGLALLGLTHLLARSVVSELARLAGVARRVVAGDIEARVRAEGNDEIAQLAGAFDEMADSLTSFVHRLEGEAERDGFRSRLGQALEMADEEEAALDVVRRAMGMIAPDAPMELLLSDSSRAHLQRAVASASGAPGCPVQSPFACVAVRRGNPVVFPDSDALDACPRLRERAGGPCSSACVPVTFMGKALGVLHATGPSGSPLPEAAVQQLTALATHSGARIGTVRAFQKTQLQATTDGLTGLINRRTLENEVRKLVSAGTSFAIAIADLDHFKRLNDKHGHEAGDRALRRFASVVRSTMRAGDIAARHGGEEFVLVYPGLDASSAVIALERLRAALREAQAGETPATTASFGVTDSGCAADLEGLLRIADAALYRAKEAGRDRIMVGESAHQPVVAPVLAVAETPESLEPHPFSLRPALHELADEEDPRPTGLEIR